MVMMVMWNALKHVWLQKIMPKSICSIDYKETFSPAVQFKICIISILLVSHPHMQQKQRQVEGDY